MEPSEGGSKVACRVDQDEEGLVLHSGVRESMVMTMNQEPRLREK